MFFFTFVLSGIAECTRVDFISIVRVYRDVVYNFPWDGFFLLKLSWDRNEMEFQSSRFD